MNMHNAAVIMLLATLACILYFTDIAYGQEGETKGSQRKTENHDDVMAIAPTSLEIQLL